MHVYTKIYEFAATVGAFEGYVYGKKNIKAEELSNWAHNIVSAYHHLPTEVIETFQGPLDRTLGRAVNSLVAALGKNHELVKELKSIIVDDSTTSPDDFKFRKWFQE